MTHRRSRLKHKRVIAITGVNGFIGSNLLKRLQSRSDYQVIALDRHQPSFLEPPTKFYQIDLTIPTIDATIAEILERESCDTFIHAAFFNSPSHSRSHPHEVEVIGSINVLHACAKVKIHKILVASTTMVYGANPTNPNFLTENHPLNINPRYRFVADKVEVEKEIRRYRKKRPETIVTVLRPCTILGPTIKNFVTDYLSRPVCITLLGYDPLFQAVHEEDLLNAWDLVIEGDYSGEYNIVGRGVLPFFTLLRLAGKPILPIFHGIAYPMVDALWLAQVTRAPAPHLDYIRYVWVADGTKAKEELGFEAKYSTKEALESYLGIQRLRQIHLVE
ncbi:MAG: NAD-dependent epimerase/dehydratase family protein [Deltaproteobacteria bacterium]|nr:NAD-dependent epimerase/dehydratase family protein [Deltaproteobacteria bacterium]